MHDYPCVVVPSRLGSGSLDVPAKKPIYSSDSLGSCTARPLKLWNRKKRLGVINDSTKASEIDLVPKSPKEKGIIGGYYVEHASGQGRGSWVSEPSRASSASSALARPQRPQG